MSRPEMSVSQPSQRHAGVHTPGLEWKETDPRISACAKLISRSLNEYRPTVVGKGSRFAIKTVDGARVQVGLHNGSQGRPVMGISAGDSQDFYIKARDIEAELGRHAADVVAPLFFEMATRRDGGHLSSGLLKEAEKLGAITISYTADENKYATIILPDAATGKMINYSRPERFPTDPVELKKFKAELIAEARQVVASIRQDLMEFSDQAMVVKKVTNDTTGKTELAVYSGFKSGLKDEAGSGVDSSGHLGKTVPFGPFETVSPIRSAPTERYYTFDREGEERRGGIKVVTFRADHASENYDPEPDRESYVIVGGFLANDQGGAKVYQEFCEAVARLTGKNVRFVEFVRDDTSRLGAESGPGWKREHPVSRFTSRVEERIKQFSEDFQREIKSKSKLEVNRVFDMVDALREEGISGSILAGHSLGGLGAEFAKGLADRIAPEMIDLAFGEAAVGHNKAYPIPAKLLGLFAWDEILKNPGKVLMKGTKDEKKRVRIHAAAVLKSLGRGPIRRLAEVAGIRKTQIMPDSTHLAGVIQPKNDRVFGLGRMEPAFVGKDGYVREGKGEHNTIIVDPENAAEEFVEFVRNTREGRSQMISSVGDMSI